MKHQTNSVRSKLGELGALSGKTEQAERNILKAAEQRLEDVQKKIKRLAPGIEIAPQQEQDQYSSLIEERGQLNVVIAKAKSALNE